jgi:holin-like protein
MIRSCFIIFGCLAAGEGLIRLTGIHLPSSIIGMLLLTLLLKFGWVRESWVNGLSKVLIANLGFFFIPASVALMLYLDLIAAQWLPIVGATVVSTILVLLVTGHTHQLVRRLLNKKNKAGAMNETPASKN